MNYETAAAAINRHFEAEWNKRTPAAYDDVPFDIPNGEPWVRLIVQHALGYQATVGAPGSNAFRREGLVTVQIFTPAGNGKIKAMQLADQVNPIFQRIGRVAGIAFQDVRLNEVGNGSTGWYHINIKTEFEYDTYA
ncbi:DUF4128 domain-containing protein [Hymenobacter sp. HSC-4F20]|uniref:phage tail terminator-like protein n=1 Tax=Hymenobacter sp. HSC-4F20 TaxID=2864135 RepID=UPI001C734469|nr:phage tail terminator-like protein [Hymenobacter sp. HSC-4F20]MBX0289722.1 DUF4128 domain-containing protein [Hymenobacter sp. HSC-4F20]